jgi:2-C-methyl-D-erythritol 2,4-cyclodiphosphate synthase
LIKGSNYLEGLNNIDTVIQAERPKLLGHIFLIRESLAKTLEINVDQISVKATTMEGLGPIGEGLGMSAHAVIMLENISI